MEVLPESKEESEIRMYLHYLGCYFLIQKIRSIYYRESNAIVQKFDFQILTDLHVS
jgi:hypothetical protein